ncbi:MAG: hypothetical protein ACTS7D_01175 [Candidatus Hodgkinia cicadicola]
MHFAHNAKPVLTMSKPPETNKSLVVRKSTITLTSFERNPETVLTASKKAIANVCKVSPTALTFALNVPSLLQHLILSLSSKGDEVILCDQDFPTIASQVFTSLALPVVVKGKTLQTRTLNILNTANPKTKLVYMLIPSNFQNLTSLQHFRNLLPSHITLVLNFGPSNFPVLASSPSAESELTGNIIVLRTFPPCVPPLNFAWMHAKAFRISPPSELINPFTIHKVTKTMMVNAINNLFHWNVQNSANLFWGTKLASQIRSNQLTLQTVQSNYVTMQLIKRLPAVLAQQWFKALGAPIAITASANIFNAISFRLSSATANSHSAKSLSSIKTMGAVVKTICAHPFCPSPSFWTKVPQPAAASRNILSTRRGT